jgi:hypothetical protein
MDVNVPNSNNPLLFHCTTPHGVVKIRRTSQFTVVESEWSILFWKFTRFIYHIARQRDFIAVILHVLTVEIIIVLEGDNFLSTKPMTHVSSI